MQIEHIDAPDWFVERTPDAPKKLWVRGDANLVFDPFGERLAIVGSRSCSSYGRLMAREWAQELAKATFTIVSGLARGIDTSAHEGALEAGTGGGLTIAVLGCGIDQDYPSVNTGLAARIIGYGGAIVSEYAPGTPPAPWQFAKRNRIIAGLSKSMLVVEAGENSGSLVAAEYALECGSELFAVPGTLTHHVSRGSNQLIADKRAQLAMSVDALVATLSPF